MPKILSQAGMSLADMYDIRGSSIGIEQLEARDISLVHEMGETLFSERLSSAIRRISTGALAQSTSWDIIIDDLPDGIFRILGVVVLANSSVNTARAQVSLRGQGRDTPLLIWDDTNDFETAIRIDDGGGVAEQVALMPLAPGGRVPTLGVGVGQPQVINDIAFRGVTSAFGAGTVVLTALIHICFTHLGGNVPGNNGLAVPGW